MSHNRFLSMLVVLLTLTLCAAPAAAHSPQPGPSGVDSSADLALAQLQATAGDGLTVSYHSETGLVRYLAAPVGRALAAPESLAPLAVDATPDALARAFLAENGALFGIGGPGSDLSVVVSESDDLGRHFTRFQQTHSGVPVLAGELIVQADARGNIVSVNGEALADIMASADPGISAEVARTRALARVARAYGLAPEDLTAADPALWYYNPALLGGPGPRQTTLVWRTEVTPRDLQPIRELVLVNAQTGIVSLSFNQIADGKQRVIYDNNNNPSAGLPGFGPVRTEGGGATGIADVDNAYDFAGDTYDFYMNVHGRDSLDNAGMQLISTVRYCPNAANCPYPNAFWNGNQMAYGAGFASADDVVAHELTHGVTEHESNLFYYMQSGAINEALSDIWGEWVDLGNGRGNDSSGVRWLIGEDLGGAFRSMSNPPTYGDPDRMGSVNYYCNADVDGGGVHTNSGVANKAAYLLTDGGSFNGKTVGALGINKTARIWYRVQTNLLTSGSDYQDLHDLLQQSCTDQIGTNGITAVDCQQVENAVDATQMNIQPTLCPAPEAPFCGVGASLVYLFQDDLEDPSSGHWTSSASVGPNVWYYPQQINPYNYPMQYATSGQLHFWGDDISQQSDSNIRMASGSQVSLPANRTAYLRFRHAYAFEDSASGASRYDGGVLEYSTDNGGSWQDTNGFSSGYKVNWYNGQIINGFGNPLAGRMAFTAESNGYISSRLNLSSLAGQTVRFRWRIGTDTVVDDWGWMIDDVAIYTCVYPNEVFLPLTIR